MSPGGAWTTGPFARWWRSAWPPATDIYSDLLVVDQGDENTKSGMTFGDPFHPDYEGKCEVCGRQYRPRRRVVELRLDGEFAGIAHHSCAKKKL